MTLAAQMTSDFDATYTANEFAEVVAYTPKGGAEVNITGFVTPESGYQEPYVRGDKFARASLVCRKSEVSNPQNGDEFTFDSSDWAFAPEGVEVYTRVGGDVYEWKIHLERKE